MLLIAAGSTIEDAEVIVVLAKIDNQTERRLIEGYNF